MKSILKRVIMLIIIMIGILFTINACSTVNSAESKYESMKIAMREELCTEIANNWVGVFLRYKGPDDFLNKCNLITYDTELELAQKVRPLVPDGHFYIGLADFHDDNHFEEAKIIPMVATYDMYDNAVIAKSTDKLREMGLKEGNIILKINSIEVLYYIDKIMELLPQSSYFESKEKAYRLLFTSVLKPYDNYYFEIPFLDTSSPVKILYMDTTTGEINSVEVDFEPMEENLPIDFLSTSLNDYWSIQRYYDVSEDNYCTLGNEFATLKEINGEKWLIYHPLSFFYDFRDDEIIKESFTCYMKYVNEADYFILDLRDSVGGTIIPINVMMGIIDAKKSIVYSNDTWTDGELYESGDTYVEPKTIEGLPSIGETKKVYIWVNAIAGSAADIFLHAVRNSAEEHIKIIGKPSAGRVQAITYTGILDYSVTMPFMAIYDEIGMQLEGKPIFPDYYFDVEAKDYRTPDEVLNKYIAFIKKNNL